MLTTTNNPIVEIVGNQIVTNTLNVAEVFGKEHKVVLNRLTNLDAPEEFGRHNFMPTSYSDSQGRPQPMYNLTRDGFTLLVMGFTGKKAMQFKLAYIQRFNEMEELLRSRPAEVVNPYISMDRIGFIEESLKLAKEVAVLTDENRHLIATVEHQEEIIQQKEEKIEVYESKALRKFLLSTPIINSKTQKELSLSAKLDALKSLGYAKRHYKGPNVPTEKALEAGYAYQDSFTPKGHKKALPYTMITPKGQRELPDQLRAYINNYNV